MAQRRKKGSLFNTTEARHDELKRPRHDTYDGEIIKIQSPSTFKKGFISRQDLLTKRPIPPHDVAQYQPLLLKSLRHQDKTS